MFEKAPISPVLNNHTLHLWLASLLRTPAEIQVFLKTLSPDEVARYEHLKSDKAKQHFITARGILRAILGRYLKTPPEQIAFGYGESGKPFLLHAALQFNVSHSGDYAFYGVCSSPIGVDIERKQRTLEVDAIAKRFFSNDEFTIISSLPEQEKQAGFLSLWAKKEAVVKALGTGLTQRLSNFSVSLESDTLHCMDNTIQEANQWSVLSIDALPDYHMAIATPMKLKTIKQWNY